MEKKGKRTTVDAPRSLLASELIAKPEENRASSFGLERERALSLRSFLERKKNGKSTPTGVYWDREIASNVEHV